mmetsp:Transcript_101865/g.265917  ORF Transcript_101865/g.265917 Transcript_101865/m.265917 type:complete len:147 (+) Transcript_101865:34-474(+)
MFQAKLANSVHEPINPQHCTNNSSGIWREPWRSELLSSMRHPQMLNISHSLDWEGHEQLHRRRAQKHFLCTIVGPDSSYSPLEIHICWKVLSEDRMEPPIHTEYLRSGGATTLIFIVEGARAVSSFVMRSPMPVNIVVPPDSTMFA